MKFLEKSWNTPEVVPGRITGMYSKEIPGAFSREILEKNYERGFPGKMSERVSSILVLISSK